jgi:nucleotide-binding universal stress UspA family protein
MNTILVAVDFSPVTRLLLQAAERVADVSTKVYLIHVAAPEPDFVGYTVGPQIH